MVRALAVPAEDWDSVPTWQAAHSGNSSSRGSDVLSCLLGHCIHVVDINTFRTSFEELLLQDWTMSMSVGHFPNCN